MQDMEINVDTKHWISNTARSDSRDTKYYKTIGLY